MTQVQPFTFPTTGQSVRTLLVDGQPWFIAADVTEILGYANGRDAAARLPERMRNTVALTDGTPGNPNRTIISEPGVYRLVMRSTLPGAEAFQDWLAEDVVPAIRTTGSYAAPGAAPALPDMATPQGRIAVARALLAAAEREVELTDRIAELEPKALAHDAFTVAADSDRLVAKVAKDLGWREKDLRAFLLDEKLIFRRQRVCGGFEYDFYAAFTPHFSAKETQVEHTWGPCNHYTLYVTPRGMDLIQARIVKRQAEQQVAIRGAAL